MKGLIKKIKEAQLVFVCGNGGSAATAEHLVEDLFSKGIRAICLNSNTPLLTMLANDYGYKWVFAKQLEVLATSNDLLITISCSGRSQNIALAKAVATGIGMNTYSFRTFGKRKNYESLEDDHLKFAHQIKKQL